MESSRRAMCRHSASGGTPRFPPPYRVANQISLGDSDLHIVINELQSYPYRSRPRKTGCFAGRRFRARVPITFVARSPRVREWVCDTLQARGGCKGSLRQISACGAVGLVALYSTSVKVCVLNVELAHCSDRFRLRSAKVFRGNVENGRQIRRRKILSRSFATYSRRRKSRRRQPRFVDIDRVPRHRVIGAEDERTCIDEEDAVGVEGCRKARVAGFRCGFFFGGKSVV